MSDPIGYDFGGSDFDFKEQSLLRNVRTVLKN
jgi:hypothetical protein